jgi:hypothetical protein
MKRLLVVTLAAMACCTAGVGCRHAFPHYPDPSFAHRRHEGPFLGFPGSGNRWGKHHGGQCGCPGGGCGPGGCGLAGRGIGGGLGGGQPLEPAPGMSAGAVGYPYYTHRGPRDFFINNPPSIGP